MSILACTCIRTAVHTLMCMQIHATLTRARMCTHTHHARFSFIRAFIPPFFLSPSVPEARGGPGTWPVLSDLVRGMNGRGGGRSALRRAPWETAQLARRSDSGPRGRTASWAGPRGRQTDRPRTGRGPGGGTRLPGGPRGPEASRPPALHVVRGFRKGKYMTRWVAATSRAPGMPPRGQAQVPGGRGVRRLPPPWRTVGGPQSLARKGRATPPSPSACCLHFESQPRAEWLLPSRLPSRMTHVRERRQDGLAESQPRGGTPSKTRSPPALLPAGRPRGAHHVRHPVVRSSRAFCRYFC